MVSTSVASPPIREVAAGIGFTEGPVWTSDGKLVVTSMSRGVLYEVPTDGGDAFVHAETGGGPNGLAERADGTLWVAQNGGVIIESRSSRPAPAGLQRVTGDVVEDLVNGGFEAPNDCVFGPDGRLWFTDPKIPGREETAGRVWAYDPDSGRLEVVTRGIGFPNGLAFLPDGKTFVVADSEHHLLVAYALGAAGLSDPVVLVELDRGSPDGLAVDRDGRIYMAATSADAVLVYDHHGSLVRAIEIGEPSMPTNLCFGGPDLSTLFVTVAKGGRVLAIDGDFPGAPASPWAER